MMLATLKRLLTTSGRAKFPMRLSCFIDFYLKC